MNFIRACFFGLGYLLHGGWRSLPGSLIRRRKAAVQQRVADFPVCRRVVHTENLTVEGQHTAMLSAMMAAPHIFRWEDTQPAPAVTAQRAVRIDPAAPAPPDIQAEQGNDIHDGKREIR